MAMTRDELIVKLGISQLDINEQQKVLENIASAVSARIWNKVSELLTETDLDKIEQFIEEDKNDEVEALIKAKFPVYEKFAKTTEKEVINQLLAGMQASAEAYSKLA